MGHWNVVRATQCVDIFLWRYFRFQIMFLQWCTSRSKFSSQENLCLQSLGSQGSYCFFFRDARTRTSLGTVLKTLKPILGDTSKILFEDHFSHKSQPKRSDWPFLCHQNSRDRAVPSIPLLRTLHHVAFAALVAEDLSTHRVAVIKTVLTEDSRVIPELTNLVAGSSMMHSARLLILYSPIAEFLLSAFHRSFGSNLVSRPKRTMIPH